MGSGENRVSDKKLLTPKMNSGEDNTSNIHLKDTVNQKRNLYPIPFLKDNTKIKIHHKNYGTSNKHLNVTFSNKPKLETDPNELDISHYKDKNLYSKLKQILKLICSSAIGVFWNSESGFIFNIGGNILSLERNEKILQPNHDPLLNAIEIEINISTESLQVSAKKFTYNGYNI